MKRIFCLAVVALLLLMLLVNANFSSGASAPLIVPDDNATVQTTVGAAVNASSAAAELVSEKTSTIFGLCIDASDQSWNTSLWQNELENSGCGWIKMTLYNSKRSLYVNSMKILELLHNESMKCLGIFGRDLNVWNGTANAPVPINNLTEWQTLVQSALQNYGPFLDAVECWNEPDLTQNQNGYMNSPQHYVQMLQILYNETKIYAEDYNKTINVLAGAVVTIYPVPGGVLGAGALFIQDIKGNGSDDFCDAYSMHIYKADANPPVNANPEQFLRGHTAAEAYEYIKNIADANTTNPKPLWVSEMGTHNNTDMGQADQMETWFYELTSVSCPMIFWYNYVDPIENMHGILNTTTLDERPAYHVYSECVLVGFARVYIRADGSIDPATAPISTVDNVTYTLNDSINDSIVIERYGIVIDGAGCTLQGPGSGDTGISLGSGGSVTIKRLTIKAFSYGICSNSSSGNVLSGNNITNNLYGIDLDSGLNDSIFHNNFVNNTFQAISNDSTNIWDNGYPSGGNYWSDYSGTDVYRGSYQNETGSDGIGDMSYVIDANSTDRYPLMVPFGSGHDVAVTDVQTSKTVVGQGYNMSITVIVADYGAFNETFTTTVYANTTVTYAQSINLTSGTAKTITFAWNTTNLVYGNYSISAYAWPILGETDTADNNFTGGWVIVSLVGDITGRNGWPDGKVDMNDIAYVAAFFGTTSSSPGWKPNADINNDGKIDMKDIAIAAALFGQHYP